MSPNQPLPIVFFDGYCGLCDRFVSFLLRADRDGRLLFAPLQGTTAESHLPSELRNQDALKSVVLLDGAGIHTQSKAAILALAYLGGGWRSIRGLLWLPSRLRDEIYDLVAARRYQWFGRRETCRLPTEEERARFLP